MEQKLRYQEWLNKKCPEHEFVYRCKRTANNATFAIRQCKKCNYMPHENLKKKDVKDFDFLYGIGEIKENCPDDNWSLYEVYSRSYNEKYYVELKSINVNEQIEKKQKYSQYLFSDKWKEIRKKVLKRDNYICQGCLENKAEEVHHKNYLHLFDELLFDLVSVCKSCHIKIHYYQHNKTI